MRLKTVCVVTAVLLLLAIAAGCAGNPQGTSTPAVTGSAEIQTQTPEPSESASVEPSPSDTGVSTLLETMMIKAKEGMVINCDFPVENTVIDDVIKEWGEPDSSNYVEDAKGTYDTYNSKNVVFGFNKGAQIFEVRSFDPELKTIGIADVQAAYGNPDYTSEIASAGQQISGYVVNDKYKMLLVFDMSTDSQNPKLDHYSVFYPQGTVNSMADDPGREW